MTLVSVAVGARRRSQLGRPRRSSPGRPALGPRLLLLLPQVDPHVSPPLVTSGKPPPTLLAGEGLLAGVRADVRGQVVAAAEAAHADAALERLVAGVDAEVAAQLVRAGEPAIAALRRARVRPLVHRRFAGSVRVLPGPRDGSEGKVLVAGESSGHRTVDSWGRAKREVPDRVEGRQRRGHPEGVQGVRQRLPVRKWRLDFSLTALLVEASVLWHEGEQCGAVHAGFGSRAVGRGGVVGHGGRGQVPACRLVLVHVAAAGVGGAGMRGGLRNGVHVAGVRLSVRHRRALIFSWRQRRFTPERRPGSSGRSCGWTMDELEGKESTASP